MRLQGQDFIDAVRTAASAHAYEVWALERLESAIGFDAAYFGRFGVPTESRCGFDEGVVWRTRGRWPLYVKESMPLRRISLSVPGSLVLDTEEHRSYFDATSYRDEWMRAYCLRGSPGFMSFRGLSTEVLMLSRAGRFSSQEKERLQGYIGALRSARWPCVPGSTSSRRPLLKADTEERLQPIIRKRR